MPGSLSGAAAKDPKPAAAHGGMQLQLQLQLLHDTLYLGS
eukprot:SAG11_NODE_619_length_8173_cov_4.837255_3_plen_40_part_00